MSAKEVQDLMLRVRGLVLDLYEENLHFKSRSRSANSSSSGTTPNTTTTATTATLSSCTLSTNSTRPPPYQTVINFSKPKNKMSTGRGALIVFEGLDRVGKSTLARKLVDHFKRVRRPVTLIRFPDRTTPIANRWEFNAKIRQSLLEGETVIVDRYSYSGIAYSCAKEDLSLDWCCEAEKGLPQPDLVIYLELPREAQYSREGFGDERFETKVMQELVRLKYEQVMEKSDEMWLRVNVEHKSPDEILAEIVSPVRRRIEACATKQIGSLEFMNSSSSN